jgi:SAM-dependent methyltransferase
MKARQRASSRADYDPIARFYAAHWCSHYHPWALRILDRLLLSRLPRGSRILDLCCGTGALMAALRARGFEVCGVDASEGMLAQARRLLPGAELVLADATQFRVASGVDAAVCTFDSLNHILSYEELEQAFESVRSALVRGGPFVFDITTDDAFLKGWRSTCAQVSDAEAFFVRGRYDSDSRLGETQVTIFQKGKRWRRTDAVLLQRCYAPEEVIPLLRRAGFSRVGIFDPSQDPDTDGPMALGRLFLVAEV